MPDADVVTSAPELPAAAPAPAPSESRRPESFADKMERLGWKPEEKHDANPNALGSLAREAEAAEKAAKTERKGKAKPAAAAETAKPEPPAAEAAETAAEVIADPSAAKREQLTALIAELGLQLEDGRVTNKERAELRGAQKRLRDELASREREAMTRIEAAAKKLEERDGEAAPKLARLAEFDAAVASGDHEAFAKLAGFENYDKFQEHVIALKQDPAYKRLRALEQEAAERSKHDAERAEREAKSAEEKKQSEENERLAREAAENRRVYIADLTTKMSSSADPLAKAMSIDPAFVSSVARTQWEGWDGISEPMSAEQALDYVAPGQTMPLRGHLKALYERLSPVFGSPAPAEAPKPARTEPEKPRAKAPAAPPRPAPSVKKLNDQEWKEQARIRMQEAAREEEMAKRGRRTG